MYPEKLQRLFDGSIFILFFFSDVPVMHLITVPFPTVWHTVNDNEQALNSRRMTTITQILTQFVAEYLHLRVPPK